MWQFIEMFGNPVTNNKGWNTLPIKDVAPETSSLEKQTGKVWILNLDMIESNTGKVVEKVFENDSNLLSVAPFDEGNVLYSKLRPYLNKVVIPDGKGYATTELVPLRPNQKLLNLTFFSHLLRGDDFVTYANSISTGTKMPRMSLNDLRKFQCILPPMEKQNEFEEIAHQADKSGFDGFKSQFIEMFKCSAERVALSSLCDTFIDGDWIEAKDQSDSGIRLIQTGNVGVGTFKDKGDKARYISEDTFNRLNCTEVVEGDILISRLPDPVGRACIIPAGLGKYITAVDCTIIRLNDKVLPKFFVAFTSTPDYAMQIKKVLSGTTRLRVSRSNLGKIQVPLPSVDKQQQFVTIAEQADKSGSVGLKSITVFVYCFISAFYALKGRKVKS